MRKYIGNVHVSDYKDEFGARIHEFANEASGPDRELEFHYSQSTEPCGRVLFSALIVVYEVTAA